MWKLLFDQLHDRGMMVEPGLSDLEVAAVEERFGFRFPPDLRTFLQTALPSGEGFPDWRNGNDAELREWLALPLRGLLFDVWYGFWLDEWGARPVSWTEAEQVVRGLVSAAPKLVPVCQHRMMADEPHAPGNPVFSVHQTDIIWYGFDLEDYLKHEWDLPNRRPWRKPRLIRFWDIERFQSVRWTDGGVCPFDNSGGGPP